MFINLIVGPFQQEKAGINPPVFNPIRACIMGVEFATFFSKPVCSLYIRTKLSPQKLLMFNNLIVGPFQQEKEDINPLVYNPKLAYIESAMGKITICHNFLTNKDNFMKF